MKSNRCTTLTLVLILCTFSDLPAVFSSPLQRRQNRAVKLEAASRCDILHIHETRTSLGCAGTGACSVSVGDPTKNANVRHTRHASTVDEESYPYPTRIESESTASARSSRSRRSRTHRSSHTLTNVSTDDDDRRIAFLFSSPSISHTTFFATMFMGSTVPLSEDLDHSYPSSSILADHNPVAIPVNGQSKPGASPALLWAAGSVCFLISVGMCFWLLRRYQRKSDGPDLSHDYVIASTESSSTLSTSNSLRSLGGDVDAELSDYPRSKVDNGSSFIIESAFVYPTSPRQSHVEQNMRTIKSDVKENQFSHLQAAPFPKKEDLCRFVFPSMGASVQREILMSRDATQVPSQISLAASSPRILTATRPFNSQSRRLLPKPSGFKSQAKPRKRFSPLGDVLYSTSGADVLETVREESPFDLSPEIPVVDHNNHEADDGGIVVVASSNSYTSIPPAGLRARRKSSPLLPSPDECFLQEIAPPLAGANGLGRARHRRSVATVDLNSLIPANSLQPMSEEDAKFAEFVKQLTRRANLGRREKRISLSKFANPTIFIPDISEDHEGNLFGKDTSQFNADYLAPPISAANLSDFSNSSSSLSSDIGSSSSSSSVVGLAL